MPASPVPRPVPTAVLSVSALTNRLRGLVNREYGEVWVRGEVSQPRLAAAGHLYFTLKDDEAVLPCAIWRSTLAALKFRIEEGMEVVALGGLDVYPPHGKYQLIVRHVEPLGAGALQIAFEQLKKRLLAEGLFEAARKRKIPSLPRRIALVTSRAGAAVRDLVTVISRRFPRVVILLVDVRVQGAAAAPEVAAGLRFADRHAGADVIVCGRGGGSLEDLWAFNEEVVARAIVACRVPVISAVGHETDTTIADLVADLRAATPSQAGELVVPSYADLVARIDAQRRHLAAQMRRRLDAAWQRLEARAERPVLRDPRGLLQRRRERLAHLGERLRSRSPVAALRRRAEAVAGLRARLEACAERRVAAARARAEALDGRLEALSPVAVLRRGYSITTHEDGTVLRRASDAAPGERIRTRLGDGGGVDSRVEEVRPPHSGGEGAA